MGSKEEGCSGLELERTKNYARQKGKFLSKEYKSGEAIQNELFIGAERGRINAV